MAGEPRPKTVLVVEDHPINMKLAADVLELNGLIVLKAFDGETALQLLQQSKPDLVLLDIHLPGMDGLEVFRRIRADKHLKGIRVVALTASAMREEEEKIRGCGFDEYIAKPINPKAFMETIRPLLG
jgi:two-component system cell cycle response regulator DivK